MCDRFHCLPSQILAEPAEFLRLIEINHLAQPPEGTEEGEWDDD